MVFLLLLTTCFVSLTVVHVAAAPVSKLIDLSYPFVENETIYWPVKGNDPFKYDFGYKHTVRGVFVQGNKFTSGEHGGTHMDAPNHFIKDSYGLDKIKLDDVVGEGIVVNVSAKVEKDPNAELEISDLEEWEKKHGRIPDNPVVFMYSGRGRFWPDKVKYFGSKTPENSSTLNFPGMHPEAAKWLIKNRKIKLFGLDTPSFDKATSVGYKTHIYLLAAGVPGIENVAHLDRLPSKGFEVFAAPMNIKDGTGGPVRVFARIIDKKEVNAATHAHMSSAIVAMAMAIVLLVN